MKSIFSSTIEAAISSDTRGDSGQYFRTDLVFIIYPGNDLPSFIHHRQSVMYADDAQFIDADAPANVGDRRARVENTLEIVLNWFT